jgi:dihydrofolate reductase
MGRATYNSIGRPLPNRLNIVMTRSAKKTEGVTEVTSVKEAVETASKNKNSSKVYVIGGENIYKEFLPIAHRMIITEVELYIEGGDTFFPEWSINEWQEQNRDQKEENGIKFSFVEYTRN